MPIVPTRPPLLPGPFAYNGDKNTIPDTGADAGAASWSSGFPPVTQLPLTAGGIPPQRNDFNGVLNAYGVLLSFIQTGALFEWSDELTYPFPCLVVGSDNTIYVWLSPSGVDTEAGAKDPVLEANRNYWISLSSFVSGDFVPDSRRVIAGTGLTGGGPLSADVTLAAKLTDSVSLADSTTAASAKAVKTAYDLANSKQANLGFTPVQQSGGAGQEGQKIYIGWSPSGLKAQADVLDLGNIVTTSAGCTKAPSAATADLATTATRLRLTGGVDTSWTYAGQGGQPAFVWGSNDGVNMDVWSPSNFNVASADISGRAQLAAPAVQWVVNTSGPAITVPPGGTYDVVCICFNDSGGKGAVKHYPGTAGGTVIPNASTDYFVAGLCARVA